MTILIKKFINFYQSQEPLSFWPITISILVALFIITLWALNYDRLPSQVPLFYSLPWGESQLASLVQFLILPAIIFLTILINLIISWHLHPSQFVIKRILISATTLIAVLILISAVKIIYTFV